MVGGFGNAPPGTNRQRSYFSARTILMVRYDPGLKDDYDQGQIRDESNPDQNLTEQRKGASQRVGSAERTGSDLVLSQKFREAITAATINIADAVATLPRPDGLTRVLDLSPLGFSRRVDTYRKADTLDLTFDWADFPIDSRLVRAILVLHYEGTVSPAVWGTGIRERDGRASTATGYAVPATGVNLRYIGLIDEITDAHGERGSILQMKSRDLTSVLIDSQYPLKLPRAKIPSGQTILQVIRGILDTNDALSIIRGPFTRTDKPLPPLDPAQYTRRLVPAKERHREDKARKASNSTNRRPFVLRFPPKEAAKVTYWDVITGLCIDHGLRPVVEKDKLILLEPRTLYKRTPEIITQPGTPTFPTIYRRQIGDTFPVRRMVYGVNVRGLRRHRKLSRIKAPTIIVRSYNPDASSADLRLIERRYPPEVVSNSTDATGNKPEEKKHIVDIHGIIDPTQLLSIATQVYEGIGRQELGVVVETNEVASFSDNLSFDPNQDPDLLDIRFGDPIQILVTPLQAESTSLFTLSELQQKYSGAIGQVSGGQSSFTTTVNRLIKAGWTRENAEQLTRVIASAQVPREFRVIAASINYDGQGEGGVSISIDARDYIRARADPDDVAQVGELTAEELQTGIGRTARELEEQIALNPRVK